MMLNIVGIVMIVVGVFALIFTYIQIRFLKFIEQGGKGI